MNNDDGDSNGGGFDRRRFLQSLAVSSLGPAAFSAGASAEGASTGDEALPLLAEQGDEQWNLTPLSTGESVVEFYGWGGEGDQTAKTSLGIERSNVSNAFLFDGPEGTSLGVFHDAPDDGSDGRATISFDGLPVGEAGETVFTDDFDSLDAWNTSTTSNAGVTVDDGRMRFRVYKCNTAAAVHDLGEQSGTLEISFSWETEADEWYEIPDWELQDADGNAIEYEVLSGTDVRGAGDPGGQRGGSVTVQATVDGPVSIRFALEPSRYCSNFDHADTYFWVDDLTVESVASGGSWVVQDDPEDFDGEEPTLDTEVDWYWLAKNTDGGAFRGGLDGEFAVTLTPDFKRGIDEWHLLRQGESETTESLRAFDLQNDYSSEERTTDWQEVSLDLSAYAGQSVRIRFQADGRHTYDYENTKSWVQADYVRLPGALDESFDTLDGWTCENQPRGDGYDDTPTVGTCEVRDGTAYVEEHTNRMRSLSRTVVVPESGDQTLTARVRGHVSAAWSNARLAVEVTEPTVERIELDTDEPVTIRRGEAETTPASVLDVSPPPTAVERGEAPGLSVELDPGSADPADLTAVASVFGYWRGDSLDIADGRATTYTQVLSKTTTDDGTVLFDDLLPAATDLPLIDSLERGFEYEVSVRVIDESAGETVATLGDFHTFAFDQVDTVAAVAARASDTTPQLVDAGLRVHLRQKVEYLNRYYASGLGSMGAQGFDVEFVNFTTENTGALDSGWVPLPDQWDHYAQPDNDNDGRHIDEVPGDNTFDFVTDALSAAATDLDVDFDQYDTALVTNGKDTMRSVGGDDQWGLSRSVWRGEPMKEFTIPVLNVTVDPGEIAGMTPFETPSGTIDAMYAPMHVDTWLHEFGHSLGPDQQVGFPDLYDIPTPFQNFGVINGWGLMGGRDGKVVSSFCRTLGSDPYNYQNGWLDADITPHVVDDVEVGVDPLTEKQVGDAADYVVSAWANVDIEVSLDEVDVDADPQLGLYIVEGRDGGLALRSPDGYELWKTPDKDAESGVQLYRFNGITVEGSVSGLEEFVEDILDGEVPDAPNLTLNDADAISIEAMPPSSGDIDEHTLANEGDTLTDPASATTFELVSDGEDGSGTVNLHRDTGLLGDSYRLIVDVLGGLQDLADEYSSGSHEEPIPPLDVMAVTADGRRVGVDEETGEVVNEVDGASVYQTPTSTAVSLPRAVEATFSVSAHRLHHALEDRPDLTVPEAIEYRRTIVDDGDLSVTERDGVAFIDGRVTYSTTATVGDEESGSAPAVATCDIELSPDRLNAKAKGKWVTAHVGLPEGTAADDLRVDSVALAGVPAVADEQYGFVKNPPTTTRNSRTYVEVKFPRSDLLDALDVGSSEIPVFAALADRETLLRGTTEVTVVEPGNGGGNGNGKGKQGGSP
ncbi:hypothetical protein [Haloarchaeobius sp. DYHT-AS-18]|uniref:hypothetical protein n=1 Tax=Haloarchaeobius sp. DYHT-AS-18 TaxID=3446117 RepID=UPI003EBC9FC5